MYGIKHMLFQAQANNQCLVQVQKMAFSKILGVRTLQGRTYPFITDPHKETLLWGRDLILTPHRLRAASFVL